MSNKLNEVFKTGIDEKQYYLREMRKCKDPVYFIMNYIHILTPKSKQGSSKFDMYDFQKDCVAAFEENRFNVVLKSRQIGMSTLVSSYIIWLMLFHKNRNILIVSIRREDSAELIQKIKYAYENLPQWLKKIAQPKSDNVHTFELDNYSKVSASSTTENMGRGKSLTHLMIDEAAFIEGLGQAWVSAWPTISVNGSVIVFSTPNGQGNFFHELYSKSEKGENEFNHIKLDWTVDPTRDEKWYNTTISGMSKRQFAQEFSCNFLLSGETVIDGEDILKLKNKILNPETVGTLSRKLWTWKEPEGDREYAISADVARGDGEDYSAFCIMDLNSGEVVATYKDKIKTEQYAELLYDMAELYNKALLIVENNNHGWAVLQKLISMKYSNLFWMDKKTQEIIEGYIDETRTDITPGFPTNVKTRNMLITLLEESIRTQKVKLYCSRTIEEMETFIWENGKAQAKKGKNDDLLMSLAIGIFVKEITYNKSMKSSDIRRLFQKTVSVIKKSLNYTLPGENGYSVEKSFIGQNGMAITKYNTLNSDEIRQVLGRPKIVEESTKKKFLNPFIKI